MASARPCRDNTPLGNGQGSVRPQSLTSLFVLGNQTKQAVRFVGYSGGEVNAVTEWKQIPEAIELQRRSIGAHKCLDEGAGDRIVIVDSAVPEIADPKAVLHEGKSPWGIELAV